MFTEGQYITDGDTIFRIQQIITDPHLLTIYQSYPLNSAIIYKLKPVVKVTKPLPLNATYTEQSLYKRNIFLPVFSSYTEEQINNNFTLVNNQDYYIKMYG